MHNYILLSGIFGIFQAVLSYYLIKTVTWDPISLGFCVRRYEPSLHIAIKAMPGRCGEAARGCRGVLGPCCSRETKTTPNPVCFSPADKRLCTNTLDLMERYFSIICEFSVKLIPLNVMLRAKLFLPL